MYKRQVVPYKQGDDTDEWIEKFIQINHDTKWFQPLKEALMALREFKAVSYTHLLRLFVKVFQNNVLFNKTALCGRYYISAEGCF